MPTQTSIVRSQEAVPKPKLPIRIQSKTSASKLQKSLAYYGTSSALTVALGTYLGSIGLAFGASFILAKAVRWRFIRTLLISSALTAGIAYHFNPKYAPHAAAGGTVVGSFVAWRKRDRKEIEVLEGTELADSPEQQQRSLDQRHAQFLQRHHLSSSKRFEVAGQHLSGEQNHRNFLLLGSPGSGKSQALNNIFEQLRNDSQWRVIVLDRNGEFMRYFCDPEFDLINNPYDQRSIQWSHRSEQIPYEQIARALISDKLSDEPIWPAASRELFRVLAHKCQSNQELWRVLTQADLKQIRDLVHGTPALRYFGDAKLASNVLSFFADRISFYDLLPATANPFSFFHWAASNDPRWLWMPLFELQEERMRPYLTLSMELLCRGLLSQDGRRIKTAIIIDELAALDEIPSLKNLLSQGRKFQTSLFLATQALAQVRQVYGDDMESILLQTTQTKLILNSPDPDSATKLAETIGQQVCLEAPWTNSISRKMEMLVKRELAYIPHWLSNGMVAVAKECEVLFPRKIPPREEWAYRTRFAVMPSVIQSLPSLQGYLLVSDGTPISRVSVPLKRFQPITQPFLARNTSVSVEDVSNSKLIA